ncbi:MAG: cupin domain-containing protein [Candidatus Limnocylindrales bacterium]
MDVRRFGPGHRRPEGPPGTQGVTGTVIHQDARGLIVEMAFERHAVIAPHDNPNTTLFIVISGGGYVQVADERIRVNQGEAVVWPAAVLHGAYTEGTEMRAIIVELPGADDAWARGVLDALPAATDRDVPASLAEGALAPKSATRAEHDESHGEPW